MGEAYRWCYTADRPAAEYVLPLPIQLSRKEHAIAFAGGFTSYIEFHCAMGHQTIDKDAELISERPADNLPPTGGRHGGQSDTPSPSRSSTATYRASFPARALADRDTIFRLSTAPPNTPRSSSCRGRPTPRRMGQHNQPIQRFTGSAIKRLKSDNGGEYIASRLQYFLRRKGKVHDTVPPAPPGPRSFPAISRKLPPWYYEWRGEGRGEGRGEVCGVCGRRGSSREGVGLSLRRPLRQRVGDGGGPLCKTRLTCHEETLTGDAKREPELRRWVPALGGPEWQATLRPNRYYVAR
ncbi:hypothetical protein BU26DRAFT_522323 [Trematosphaeria pertusa]|uniref:Integrase catalytic domain-containing protein n=1 Tax=Trematosphaeria pertusa TaxID=390896 RepID=A0A6A6I402_9PLEO|nr:uncharacterized protein BU26DRAFT_522323 [Trematosphaeria pertusa]KAF2245224.1 hypothetical protein BU26DRAFT_522323 [Trematosphaeria pertusa]